MRLYASLSVFVGPYKSLCVLIDFSQSLWIFIVTYASSLVFMGT